MYDVCFAYKPKKFKKNLASLVDYEAPQISIFLPISSGNPGICCGYTYLWKSAEINCFVGAMSVRYPPFLRPLCNIDQNMDGSDPHLSKRISLFEIRKYGIPFFRGDGF